MDEDDAELMILWFLTGGAVAIMLLRLFLKQLRQQGMKLGEYFTIAAIVSILLRGAVIHVALHHGCREENDGVYSQGYISARGWGQVDDCQSNVLYDIKCVIMCVLQRLLKGLGAEKITRFYWAILGVTFVVAFIVAFTGCHPFKLYYQVIPNPGTCAKGIIQLEVSSALNMATDLMLIALPLPSLIKIKRPLMERLRLVGLFLVGLTIVAVTMTRLLMNVVLFHRSGQSHNVANVEIFFAAFVANAPTIYGLLAIEGRMRAAPSNYPSKSYGASTSNSPGFISSASKSRALDSGRFQSGDTGRNTAWVGKSRYAGESDEEMMIELDSSAVPKIHVTTTTSVV
ncbi:hypothetical protein D0Z07_9015 [Hyphodiscus hymeniophilus]|uniref:Rhodopsin domain-containing protein n=1 Tax=Hyphodiscus hymeniophilus TaxID=353542 RepID=A0A9P6SKH3_9HELO|nr:hypothetical protein D0Z07_9015 [Hyphodiscus hymeniophilus]